MIKFPPQYTATKFPGYFWNVVDHKLYSIKVTGMLRELKYVKPTFWNKGFSGYAVSVNGRKRYLHMDYLMKLNPKRHETVPMYDARQLALF